MCQSLNMLIIPSYTNIFEFPDEILFTFLGYFTLFFFEAGFDPRFCFCGNDIIQPVFRGFLLFGSNDLNLVPVFKLIAQRNKAMVNLSAKTMRTDLRMNIEREIKGSSHGWKGDHISLR